MLYESDHHSALGFADRAQRTYYSTVPPKSVFSKHSIYVILYCATEKVE
jgi:hypothetical protein